MGTAFDDSTLTETEFDGPRTFQNPPITTEVQNLSTAVIGRLKKSGGTMTGHIVLHADASSAMHPITKQQLDAATLGLADNVKNEPCVAATTAALPACTYANGSSGVGATLTANANGALAAQDGVTLTTGARLLVRQQAAAAQNGVYTVTQLGSAGTPWTLTRATDADTAAELTIGVAVFVTDPSVATTGGLWLSNVAVTTVGTDPVTWTQIGGTATVADGSITSAKIANGTIVDADINASAAIALSKLATTGTPSASNWLRGDGAWAAPTVGAWTTESQAGTSFTISKNVTVCSNTGTVTATLPSAAASNGYPFTIYKTGNGGVVNVTRAGSDTILGGTAAFALVGQYESVTLTAVGNDWLVI